MASAGMELASEIYVRAEQGITCFQRCAGALYN